MRPILLTILCLHSFALAACTAESPRPNILLIYSDDHGWADLGSQGADKDICTPNLDQIARDGVRFTRGYVTAPQCVPSRAGVLTGRYQQRFGVEDNGKGPLPLAELTIAERLKTAGYVTGQAGKWHLDIGGKKGTKGGKAMRVQPEHMPHAQGFDEYWRGELRQFYASHDLRGRPFADAPHLVTDDRFRVVVQTEAALSFLDRRAARPGPPWFLYLAWYAPHVPLESPEPWFSKTPAHLPKERRQALAMIAAMDDGLGRIRAKLKAMGAEKNTLIFFIGDNGAPLGKAWDGSINLPMRGQKGMLSEGGIRVPFVAAWPGRIPAGQVYDHPVISLDVAATAVAQSSHHAPRDESSNDLTRSVRTTLDGVNLLPYLTGEKHGPPHDALYWRWGSQAAVQEFPYKLIALGDRERLLFDITTPEGEHIERNLLRQKPDIAARLEARLKAWCATLQPPGLPTSFDAHHEGLFTEHQIIAPSSAAAKPAGKPAPEGSVQGWICRNGTLAVRDGALVVTPDPKAAANARPFITTTDVDLPGPVTATLRIRARQGGKSAITWRTKAASFAPEQTAEFDWPASAEWREVNVELNEKSRIIHIRINPAKGASGIEVQSVVLRDAKGVVTNFRFNQKP
jgi:uncharacterized sulfatase